MLPLSHSMDKQPLSHLAEQQLKNHSLQFNFLSFPAKKELNGRGKTTPKIQYCSSPKIGPKTKETEKPPPSTPATQNLITIPTTKRPVNQFSLLNYHEIQRTKRLIKPTLKFKPVSQFSPRLRFKSAFEVHRSTKNAGETCLIFQPQPTPPFPCISPERYRQRVSAELAAEPSTTHINMQDV